MHSPQKMNWNSGTKTTTIRTTLGSGGDSRQSPLKKSSLATSEPQVTESQEREDRLKARQPSVVVYKKPRQDSTITGDQSLSPNVSEDGGVDMHSGDLTTSSDQGNGKMSREITRSGTASVVADSTSFGNEAGPQSKRQKTSQSPESTDHGPAMGSGSERENSSEDRDMLMTYATSEPTVRLDQAPVKLDGSKLDGLQQPPSDLDVQVDLVGSSATDKDKELQRRYFDIIAPSTSEMFDLRAGSGPESFGALKDAVSSVGGPDQHAPPRCLSCGADGHSQESCPELKCGNCGKIGLHFTSACPSLRTCLRCRHPSHTGPCPSEVARINCQICQGDNHDEPLCTALWRSFDPDSVPLRKVRQLPVFCYNCGSNLHFGFDCKMRRLVGPQNAKGETFSWMSASRFIDYESPAVGISVAGTGPPKPSQRRLEPDARAKTEANDDEPAQFIRPSVKRDEGRPTHIRFGNQPGGQGPAHQHHPLPERPLAAGNAHYAGGSSYDRNTFQGSGFGPANPQGHAYSGPDRSFYVSVNGSRGAPGTDRWQPPPPPGAAPPGSGFRGGTGAQNRQQSNSRNVYRPMPSAGQKAWKKHRT